MREVTIVGAGLAGCEAALQCARRGVGVQLLEMRPHRTTEAHRTADVAEIVCSNSLKSEEPENAHGLLKAELRALGSALLECAQRARIPGGKALVVDRRRFSQEVQAELDRAGVAVVRQEVGEVPRGAPTVIATGPLMSQPMAESLAELLGAERLFFHDAIAPIVSAETVDSGVAFAASRYAAGADYLNCPMSEDEYNHFIDALLEAELHPVHEFERSGSDRLIERQSDRVQDSALDHLATRSLDHSPVFFEGCLPVEEMARRGRMTLAFGPMKPVGLVDPRTGERPFAVVQLRRENAESTMYNLVGFQTRLRHAEQARVFRMIPGLDRVEFLRYGSMHRNTYLDGPKVLLPTLQARACPDLFVAGQLTGVEGYVESIGAGLVAGANAARRARGLEPVTLPEETMTGALLRYVAGNDTGPDLGHDPDSPDGDSPRPQESGHNQGQSPRIGSCPRPRFQPMNANFGLLPRLPGKARGREKKRLLAERALASAEEFRGSFV